MKKGTKVLLAIIAAALGFCFYFYRIEIFGERPRIMAFYINGDDKAFESLKANIQNLDQVIPLWIHLSGSDGSIAIDDQEDQKRVLALIGQQKRRILITPIINNVNLENQNWNSEELATMLKNSKARSKNIQAILDFVKTYNLHGINIDYEGVSSVNQKYFVLFMCELFQRLHPLGLEVTVDVPLNDEVFDVGRLSEYCDRIIFMAYDEHTLGVTSSGPIASRKWFEKGIERRIFQIGGNKCIIALGGYGYDWNEGRIDGKNLTFREVINIANKKGGRIVFDKEAQNQTYEYRDEKGCMHRVWFLDARTLSDEMSFTRGDVYGYALWRLGMEDPSIWKFFKR